MNYRTIKGAKIAFYIFATLWVINFIISILIGINTATFMTMIITFIGVIDANNCKGVLELYQELENKLS